MARIASTEALGCCERKISEEREEVVATYVLTPVLEGAGLLEGAATLLALAEPVVKLVELL